MMLPALERLGPYQLTKNLTRPGRAEVYLGRYTGDRNKDSKAGKDLPDTAVVKVLRPPDQYDPSTQARIKEALARFVEEGRLGTRIRHPAITRTYGVGYDRGQDLHFIVQEYVQGITLAQLLDHCAAQEVRLQYSVILRLVIPILKALHYAHHDAFREDGRPLRVVHRDIKPANVMLAYDGRVVLLDLASARSTSFTRQETVQDVVMGTAHYLAPEQVFDTERVGHQTDIFATAVILYELVTLTPLLPRTRRLSEIATALARFDFSDHETLIDESLYPGLRPILSQALCPDSTTRYQTAGEVVRQLEGLLIEAGDGPGLESFAADLRRKWEGGDASSQTRSEPSPKESPTLRKPQRYNLAGGDARSIEAAPYQSTPRASAAHGSQPSAQDRNKIAPPRIRRTPPEEGPSTVRSLGELAIAALVGVLVASVTWLLLEMW